MGVASFRLGVWRLFLFPQATLRGWFAEDRGQASGMNPYLEGTQEYAAWRAGWRASRQTNP